MLSVQISKAFWVTHIYIYQGTYITKLFRVELGLQQYRSISDSCELGLIWMNFVGMLEKKMFLNKTSEYIFIFSFIYTFIYTKSFQPKIVYFLKP